MPQHAAHTRPRVSVFVCVSVRSTSEASLGSANFSAKGLGSLPPAGLGALVSTVVAESGVTELDLSQNDLGAAAGRAIAAGRDEPNNNSGNDDNDVDAMKMKITMMMNIMCVFFFDWKCNLAVDLQFCF